MSRSVIAVDIDDVLLESGALIIADYNRRFGTQLSLSAFYDEHNMGAWGDVDTTTAISRVDEYVESAAFIDREPTPDVVRSLRHLAERYDLHVLTGRKDAVTTLTNVWLQRHFPGMFTSIQFSNLYNLEKRRSKGEMCVEMGASFLIDDHLLHAKSAAESGLQVVLYGDYPWNRADALPAGITRCVDWPAVVEYFDGIA